MVQHCAVVTGGARNIGAAIAHRLRQDGLRVFVLDIAEPEVGPLRADARLVDLLDADATARILLDIVAEHKVTRLVNNVGVVAPARFDEVRFEDFDRIMHLNVRTALVCARAVVPSMRQTGTGRIVMNASRVVLGKEARTLYSASKGALQSMSKTWALELAKDGITVNCVAPGPIATTAFWQNNPPEASATKNIIEEIPVGRMGTPDDVANAVSFFCDERSGFVTGQTLFVCGGVTVG